MHERRLIEEQRSTSAAVQPQTTNRRNRLLRREKEVVQRRVRERFRGRGNRLSQSRLDKRRNASDRNPSRLRDLACRVHIRRSNIE